ncbi:hypothetical protein ACWV26_07765 [Rummeliibacillus sp. JY-2-4R]
MAKNRKNREEFANEANNDLNRNQDVNNREGSDNEANFDRNSNQNDNNCEDC